MKAVSLVILLGFVGSSLSHAQEQIRNRRDVVPGSITRAATTKQKEYNDTTLKALCEEGYTVAIFLYEGAKTREVECSGGRKIKYLSISKFQEPTAVLNEISKSVNQGGRALFHCWNGLHATGYIAAAVLNRFCGFSGAQAANYFVHDVPAGSLPEKNMAFFSKRLKGLPSGGSVMAGCPSPK